MQNPRVKDTIRSQLRYLMKLTMRATLSASNSRTGRQVTCDSEYGLVQSWTHMPDRESLLLHSGRQRLADELLTVGCIKEPSIQGYRGRPQDETGPNPSSEDMGPPEPHLTNDKGRYNRKGQSALYLCDSIYGVQRELLEKGALFVQEYLLPTSELKIADLRELEPRSFLCGTMWHAEMAGREGYPAKVFSQTVGEILSEQFDGMAVPGVHGDSIQTYSNIVILRHVIRWKEWICVRRVQSLNLGYSSRN